MEEVVEGDFVAPCVDRGGWEVFCVADEYAVFFEVDDGGVGGCVVEVAAKDDESLRVLCGEFGDDLLSVGGFGASACACGVGAVRDDVCGVSRYFDAVVVYVGSDDFSR